MDEIELARQREANGVATEVDRWRLRRVDRMVTKDMSGQLDSYFVSTDDGLEQQNAIYRDMADALDLVARSMERQIRALEREVSELKGELRALRQAKIWRPGE